MAKSRAKTRKCPHCLHTFDVSIDNHGVEHLTRALMSVADNPPFIGRPLIKIVGYPSGEVIEGYRVPLGTSDRQGWRIHECQ
jgi:hypothetical protein